jgi:hypothetical protein
MRYTEAEVDAVALAIANSDRAAGGDRPIQSLSQSMSPLIYRSNARAALAARDALFETVAERWDVITRGGIRWRCGTQIVARYHRDNFRSQGHRSARVVHVTTKRRKR